MEWFKLRIELSVTSRLIPTTKGLSRLRLSDCPSSSSTDTSFDHSQWNAVLKASVSPAAATINGVTGVSTVDYGAIASDARFDAYLNALAQADIEKLPPIERFALWMNAYNALAISLINKHEKATGAAVDSINQLSTKAVKVWDMAAGVVGGKEISLGEIEHRELRGKFDEPLVHFCIVCASASCPNLRPEAFVPGRLREQMTDQLVDFLGNPTKGLAYVKKRDSFELTLSRIMLWFNNDFGGIIPAAEFAVAALPASHPLGAQPSFLRRRWFRPSYFKYDWHINRTPR